MEVDRQQNFHSLTTLPSSMEEIKDLQKGVTAKPMTDLEMVDYFKDVLRKDTGKTQQIKPVPKGQCVFLFVLIDGKTRPLTGFIDGGCNCLVRIYCVGTFDYLVHLSCV